MGHRYKFGMNNKLYTHIELTTLVHEYNGKSIIKRNRYWDIEYFGVIFETQTDYVAFLLKYDIKYTSAYSIQVPVRYKCKETRFLEKEML